MSDGGAGDVDAGLRDAAFDSASVGMPDAFTADAGRDAGVDAGRDAGRDAGVDAGRDAGVDAGRDAGTGGAGDAGADAPLTGPSVSFPTASSIVRTMFMNYWNAGDYVEGVATTSLGAITRAMLDLGITPNGLTCDTQDMDVLINGVTVGSFMIHGADTRVTGSFTFAAITGPTYTIRFQTSRTVSSGCGSAGFDVATSTVTFAP